MKNYEKELDVIAVRIEDTSNLLRCFLDFCDEDNEKGFDTQKDFAAFASYYSVKLKSQTALIKSAIFTLEREKEILWELFNEKEQAEVRCNG